MSPESYPRGGLVIVSDAPMKIAIAGCGNIATPYASDLKTYPEIVLAGAFDVDHARAQAFAAEHGCAAYGSYDDLLADPDIGLIVNLTSFQAHYTISAAALNAGKHVYSEKPLALTYADACALRDLAASKGLRLGCSPFTLMGEAPQTMWREVRAGRLGAVRAIYAEVNHGRIETWHPAPQAFYEVGPLFDVGVYPLAIVTAVFGAARRVTAYGTTLLSERQTKDGKPFRVGSPDFVVSILELASGAVVRLTTNFYVEGSTRQGEGLELHGDAGSLYLPSWFSADGEVFYAPFKGEYTLVPLVREAAPDAHWGKGVHDMVLALREGRPHRCSAEQATHLTEILEAVSQSIASGQPVALESTFTPPAPMGWAG
jgi:predicted dehydrogenase